MKNNRPTGGVVLHNIEKTRFLPSTKSISCYWGCTYSEIFADADSC